MTGKGRIILPRSNENTQSIWKDPEQDLPQGWDKGIDSSRRTEVLHDRAIDSALKKVFAEAHKAADRRAVAADDFARRLKSSIAKAPAGGSVLPMRYRLRDGVHRFQSSVLHGEGGLFRYGGVAALVLIAVIPFAVTRNDKTKIQMEEGPAASSVVVDSRAASAKVTPHEADRAVQPSGSGNWAVGSEGNVKPQLRTEPPEQKSVQTVSDFEVREKELLRSLDQAKSKDAKLAVLRDLERLYRENNAPDRMRAIQLRIEEVRK